MTHPRPVHPGRTYLITRRCSQRQFLMRPDDDTNNAFVYCLGYAAEKFGIEVLFTVAMSNHHHTGIYDPKGNYPEFLAVFHQLFAKCQNALRGRWENFWAPEQTSVVELADENAILEKLGYALANPVKDHFVEKAKDWPGVSSLNAMLEETALEARRPTHYFREEGSMPEKVTLAFKRPKAFEKCEKDEWKSLIIEAVRPFEGRARLERQKDRSIALLGVKGVLGQPWTSRPRTRAPRRDLSPTVATKNAPLRAELLRKKRDFLERYREARSAFVQGFVRAIFPNGTYWLKRFASVVTEKVPFLHVEDWLEAC